MNSKKLTKPRSKTLKDKINKYILKKGDICCERDIDRKIAIDNIFNLYIKIAEMMNEKEDHLSYINNDLVKFIGYRMNLEKIKDTEGVKLWNKLDRKMYSKKELSKANIMNLLNEVSLFYLLSFLGYAYYKYDLMKQYN